jgi:hypothetical protein
MPITTLNSQAIPADVIQSSDLDYPLTDFSSTGIDDNATSTAITIDASENVGIGTASPNALVEAQENVTDTYSASASSAPNVHLQISNEDTTTANTMSLVGFGSRGTTTTTSQWYIGNVGMNNAYADSSFVFGHRTAGSTWSEVMRLDGSGNVGINEIAPDVRLHVKGGNSGATGNSAGQVFVEGNTSAGISIGSATTNSSYVWFGDSDNIAQGRIRYDNSADKFEFRANNVDDILVLGSVEAVFNEESNNQDFRVESDTSTHALFVDAGNSRVGINSSAPSTPLDVREALSTVYTGTAQSAEHIQIFNTATGATGLTSGIRFQTRALDQTGQGFFIGATALSGGYAPNFKFQKQVGATTYQELAALNAGEAVFNDPGNNYDFRVESDTSTHALFVDATNGNIGINDTAPSSTLASGVSATGRVLSIASGGTTAISIRSTDAVNDRNAVLEMLSSGNGGSNNIIVYGDTDTTPSSKSGLIFQGYHNGSRAVRTTLDWSGYLINEIGGVFNESGADSDFRVETDINSHALFVDASLNRIGLFESSPQQAVTFGGPNIFEFRTGSQAMFRPSTNTNDHRIVALNDQGMDVVWGGAVTTSMQKWQNGNAVTFNDDSNNQDFRVESDGNANMFVVDAGLNEVIAAHNRMGAAPTAYRGEMVHFNTNMRTVAQGATGTYTLFTRSPDANVAVAGTCYIGCENSGADVQWGYIIDFFMSNGSLSTTARATGNSQGTCSASIQESGAAITVSVTYAGGLGGNIRFNASGFSTVASY